MKAFIYYCKGIMCYFKQNFRCFTLEYMFDKSIICHRLCKSD